MKNRLISKTTEVLTVKKTGAQVQKLIKDKIVEPSVSAYNSPLLIVPKKSMSRSDKKKWRLVIDYRQINKKQGKTL